jgi:hypothetical protein
MAPGRDCSCGESSTTSSAGPAKKKNGRNKFLLFFLLTMATHKQLEQFVELTKRETRDRMNNIIRVQKNKNKKMSLVVVVVGLIGSLFFFFFLLASHSAQSTNRRNGPLFFPFGFRRLPLAFFPYYSLSARPGRQKTASDNNKVRKYAIEKIPLEFGLT